MASASLTKQVSKSRYNNWVKASLAVLFTKEGIEPFVEDEIEQLQRKCLSDICNKEELEEGTICSNCFTENVVECPTKKICNTGKGKGRCTYHSSKSYISAGCPNKVCHNFKTAIQDAHRYYPPSYKNTDATKWCSNPWEVAKCFMPPDGYKDVSCAAETDFNGINSVIINCNFFQPKVTDGNIFDKARTIGRAVRHAPNLEVDDADLKQYFIDLDKLLSDPGHLLSDNHAIFARQKLSELQNDSLIIGKDDVRKVLDDVAEEAQENIKKLEDEFQIKIENEKLLLIKTTQSRLEALGDEKKLALSELKSVLDSSINIIHKHTADSLKRIHTEAETGEKRVKAQADTGVKRVKTQTDTAVKIFQTAIEEGVNKVKAEKDAATEQITTVINERKKTLSTTRKQREEDEYNAVKRDLQSDLIQLYRESCSTINICPGLEEIDASLKEVYIPPYPLYSKETDSLKQLAMQGRERGGKPLDSLEKIFNKKSNKCRNIYLTAEPGLGKTSFVKWLALNWCHAHDPIKEDCQYFKVREVSQLKEYDFTFLIFLREINIDKIHVDFMIQDHIFQNIGKKIRYTSDIIERVLCDEKCLIVLDGLDEWSVSDIPKKKPVHTNCTYITTSRPWKFCMIPLNSIQIDQHVSIENIQKFSKEKLISSIITMFEKKKCLRDDISDIEEASKDFTEILAKRNITHVFKTPFILAQLLVLWNMEKGIGNSQCEIYCDMVDALFSRSESKVKQLKQFENKMSSGINHFKESLCEKYYDLMLKLGKLAFYTLFLENKDSSLVFVEDEALRHLSDNDSNTVPKETLFACLRTGLLSKQREYIRSRKKKYTYSFQHETIQEYFAAIFIQSGYKNELKGKIASRCNTVPTILEMGTVFMFLSGLSPTTAKKVFHSFQGTINEDENTKAYRGTVCAIIDHDYEQMKTIQNMVVACVFESRNNEYENVNLLLEDIIIDFSCKHKNYRDALKILMRYNCKYLKSLFYDDRRIHSFGRYDDTAEMNPQTDMFKYFELQNMQCLCRLIIVTESQDFNEIATQLAALDSEHLKLVYFEFDQPVTGSFMETIIQFVNRKTSLESVHLHAKTNPKLEQKSFVLKLNEKMKTITLINVPVSQLQLNENLQQMTLINVHLSHLKLNEPLQEIKLVNVSMAKLQLNKQLHDLILGDVTIIDIRGFLFYVFECIPAVNFTSELSYLPLDTEQHKFSCHLLLPERRTEECKENTLTFDAECIKLTYSEGKVLLHLEKIALTSTALCKIVGFQRDYDFEVQLSKVNIEDNAAENDIETTLKDSLPTGKGFSSGKTTIHFYDVRVSSKTFLQLVKFVEKCNRNDKLVIPLHVDKPLDYVYDEGIEYARSSTSLIITEQESVMVEVFYSADASLSTYLMQDNTYRSLIILKK